MLKDIAAELGDGFRQDLFVPYVQLHEFEAMLFAAPGELARVPRTAWGNQDMPNGWQICRDRQTRKSRKYLQYKCLQLS